VSCFDRYDFSSAACGTCAPLFTATKVLLSAVLGAGEANAGFACKCSRLLLRGGCLWATTVCCDQ
jgi:hypothetical protein